MRHALIKVSPYIFIELLKEGITGIRIAKNALPEDTKFIRASCDDSSGWGYITLVLESSSFEELKDGDVIPQLPATMFEKVI